MAMVARILQLYRSLLYNIYYRHILRYRTSTQVNGIKLNIKPSVIHPKLFKSGEIFSDFLLSQDLQGKSILDMGTGSGILALTAAKKGARVTASDINPVAIKCASENFRRNGFNSDIRVFSGDLFSPITDTGYDLILFNPPYLKHSNSSAHHLALHGGEHLALIKEFAIQAQAFLHPGGSLLLIISTDSDIPLFLNIFLEHNYSPELLHRKNTAFETFYIYRFTPSQAQKIENIFTCPSCRETVTQTEDGWKCEKENLTFPLKNGIPDFLLPNRRADVEQFLDMYRTVRNNEHWGSAETHYYEELPYHDTTNEHSSVWSIRARSYDCFKEQLELDLPKRALRVLDLGAGNGWLSLRLANLGHRVVAVDIHDDDLDGLGVLRRLKKHQGSIQAVRAEFDQLPFPHNSFELIVFNASLHYASAPTRLIENTLRYLKDNGTMFIMDSPMYRDDASGRAMLEEKAKSFKREHDITVRQDLLGSYLTLKMLDQLRGICTVDILSPSYGWVWKLRPYFALLRGKRQPASFAVIKLKKKLR